MDSIITQVNREDEQLNAFANDKGKFRARAPDDSVDFWVLFWAFLETKYLCCGCSPSAEKWRARRRPKIYALHKCTCQFRSRRKATGRLLLLFFPRPVRRHRAALTRVSSPYTLRHQIGKSLVCNLEAKIKKKPDYAMIVDLDLHRKRDTSPSLRSSKMSR